MIDSFICSWEIEKLSLVHVDFFFLVFLRFYYLFLEREREGEKHQREVAPCAPPTVDLACNPGMCPDWESNQQPLVLQAGTQSTEPHQAGSSWHVLVNRRAASKKKDCWLRGLCTFCWTIAFCRTRARRWCWQRSICIFTIASNCNFGNNHCVLSGFQVDFKDLAIYVP